MSKITHVNRRSFIKVSAATGGGFVLGFSLLSACTSDPIKEPFYGEVSKPEQWNELNAFLKIGDNGVVTIFSPNPEIGQNIKTSMPMIIAEELDIDWKDVIVEQAPLDTEKYTRQVAGGSQSIRQGWTSLRTTGATARQMLLMAAADKWSVAVDELRTSDGKIYHDISNKEMHYGIVAGAAALLEVPENVTLKDPKDYTIIGKGIRNVDGKAIVTGAPVFGMDYHEEGMKYAMVEHAPSFGMSLQDFNQAELRQMPGILDAFPMTLPVEGLHRITEKAFKKNEAVVIVGNSTWSLLKAKKALTVNWSINTSPEDSNMHEATLSALLNEHDNTLRKDGEPERVFSQDLTVIEREYSAPFLPHNTMSPMNFFADVSEDKARLVGPIQLPELSAGLVADMFSIPKENVHVEMTRMGGGFGRRLYGNWLLEAAWISKHIQAPVKLIYSREDDMANGTYRPAYKVRYKAAFDNNKNVLAFHVKGAGIHGGPVFANRFPAGSIDNYLAQDESAASNISTGAWRAPKSNFIAGAEQSFIDELAEAMDLDPIDLRLQLFEKAATSPVGEENDYDANRYANVLKEVKQKSAWGSETPGIYRGVAAYYCHNSYVAQVVDITLENETPRVKKVWSAVDCGRVINPEGAKNQIEGGVIDGLSTALYGGLTFENGTPQQTNFDRYQVMRHLDAPEEIETFFINTSEEPTGLGEPGLPPVIGALANALYKATGKRYYDQPFMNSLLG